MEYRIHVIELDINVFIYNLTPIIDWLTDIMTKPIKRKGKLPSDKKESSNDDEVVGKTSGIEQGEEIEELDEKGESQAQPHHARHHLQKDKTVLKKQLHESRRVIFILGALIGLLGAVSFGAWSNPTLKNELDRLVNFDAVSGLLEDWREALPSGLQSMLSDIDAPTSDDKMYGSADSFSVGRRMATNFNLTSKYNVVMVPGVISTGIESWGLESPSECPSTNHFRKRLWGSFYMLRTMILDKTCWLKYIMLDPETGLDPPKVKLRPAQGFEAADFFMAGYWIWNKILQNLAVIGYNPNNMISASYDWRLAYLDLEVRDAYFSKLKSQIELTRKLTGQKSIIVGHSMGSQVIFYFLKWAEAKGELYGNGGPTWCNDNIAAVVDISGCLLGAPKTIPALLSGEMKDTVQLNALAVYGLEKFFSRKERTDMLRTFGGVPSMLPKGGDLIWGNATHSPDDSPDTLRTKMDSNDTILQEGDDMSFGTFIRFRNTTKNAAKNLTLDESIDFLLEWSPDWFSNRVRKQYSFGVAKTKKELKKNNNDHQKWSNPLEVSLPYAPDMKIFCFYGVGNPTERAYYYHDSEDGSSLPVTIDVEAEAPVLLGDGDGTISLLTHSICHEWKKGSASRYNPGNSSVTIVEIKHEPDRFDIRGGAKTAEHVDILGSAELNELVLRVAAGKGDEIEDRYVSNLKDIVSRMDI